MLEGDTKGKCYICKMRCDTEKHHIFGGPNRNNAEKYGLCVSLCPNCHRGTYGAHGTNGHKFQEYLHEEGQRQFERTMIRAGMAPETAREFFIREFIRNYL